MNIFIKKIFFYLLFTIVGHVAFSFFTYFNKLDTVDNTAKDISEQTIGLNRNLIIGDSRALAGIDPIKLSNNFYNISIQGSTFLEGYFQLNRILKETPIDTVILCYGQTHFEKSDYLDALMKSCRNIYSTKNLNELIAFELANNVNYTRKTGKLKLWNKIRRYLIYYCFIQRKNNPIKIVGDFFNKKTSHLYLAKQKGHLLLGQNKYTSTPNQESLEREFLINPIIKTYFYKINQLCKQNNIKVFFISPPVSKISFNMNKTYYNQYNSKICELKNNSSICFLNSTVVYNNNNFGDASHLNQSGCDKFTNDIKLRIAIKLKSSFCQIKSKN